MFYSIRAESDILFDIYDDDLNAVGVLTIQDFASALAEQKQASRAAT